jgi:hypothetical protein
MVNNKYVLSRGDRQVQSETAQAQVQKATIPDWPTTQARRHEFRSDVLKRFDRLHPGTVLRYREHLREMCLVSNEWQLPTSVKTKKCKRQCASAKFPPLPVFAFPMLLLSLSLRPNTPLHTPYSAPVRPVLSIHCQHAKKQADRRQAKHLFSATTVLEWFPCLHTDRRELGRIMKVLRQGVVCPSNSQTATAKQQQQKKKKKVGRTARQTAQRNEAVVERVRFKDQSRCERQDSYTSKERDADTFAAWVIATPLADIKHRVNKLRMDGFVAQEERTQMQGGNGHSGPPPEYRQRHHHQQQPQQSLSLTGRALFLAGVHLHNQTSHTHQHAGIDGSGRGDLTKPPLFRHNTF